MNENIYYCGVDLHKKYSFITILNQEGKVAEEVKVINDREAIAKIF
jgi:hypothetical protein